jgi:hypothetical protein
MDTNEARKIYHELKDLDHDNVVASAEYREDAQEILADPEVDLTWRQAIAHRLNEANIMLERQTVNKDDSY